jgi:CO dehydrogenase nickel-insertion accessory protein CooC1
MLREELERRGVAVLGSIGYDPEIFQSGLQGQPIRGSRAERDLERILNRLL